MYRRLTNDRSLKISVTLPCHVVDIVDTVDINIDTVNIVILLAFWYCWHCWHCRLATGNLLDYRATLLTLKSMLTVNPHSAQWNQSLSDTIFWTIRWLNFCQKVFLMNDASQSTLYIWNRCSLGNGKPSAGHISQCQGKALMQIILGMLCMRAGDLKQKTHSPMFTNKKFTKM